ncbi:MAG TPA: hypothetical protein VM368_04225 [Flavisolibacter sp.]|nr:hypothetical protein [Flavisolibacter sp.]
MILSASCTDNAEPAPDRRDHTEVENRDTSEVIGDTIPEVDTTLLNQ